MTKPENSAIGALRDSRQIKHKFQPSEDDLIRTLVQEHGAHHWSEIAAGLPGRTARQCRERWVNYLNPDVRRASWSAEENALLHEKVAEFGTLWSRIVRFFDGRTDVCLKNQYLKLQRRDRRIARMPSQQEKAAADDESGAYFINEDLQQNDWEYDEYCFDQSQNLTFQTQ